MRGVFTFTLEVKCQTGLFDRRMNEYVHIEWTCCALESAAYPIFFLSSFIFFCGTGTLRRARWCVLCACLRPQIFLCCSGMFFGLSLIVFDATHRRKQVLAMGQTQTRRNNGTRMYFIGECAHSHSSRWMESFAATYSCVFVPASRCCFGLRLFTAYSEWIGRWNANPRGESGTKVSVCVCRHLKHGNERATFHIATFERLRIFRRMCVEYKKSIFLLEFIPIYANTRLIALNLYQSICKRYPTSTTQ